ncbi:T9SS type A sorting domain-containing protein [Hyphobacterium sp. CCMP332]|nr:T9SS type A sorting domain-containing protein [Hyphobacterium sp. CCMP332]
MTSGKYLALIILLFITGNLCGQKRKAHSHLLSNFNTFQANSGGIDEYGNAYILFFHDFDLPFNNDTIQALNPIGTSTSIAKISPNGNLIWHSQASSFTIDAEIVMDDNYLYCYGRFWDTISFSGNTIIESNPSDSLFDDDVFIVKYDLNGNLKYLNGFPDKVSRISNVTLMYKSIYYTGQFENQIVLGSDTLIEDSVSNHGGTDDMFLGKLDANGNYDFSTYLGSPSQQVMIDLIVKDTSIISYGYYFATPTFAPTIIAPSFIFMQFDTLGNLINYRPLNLTVALPFMALGFNEDFELITRDFSDSAENQILANTIYGGQNHVGFYKYSFGAFSPPTYGIAYGGSTVELTNPADDKFSFSGNLISNFIKHTSGITYDGVNQINSPYSIMAFNSDQMEVQWSEAVSGELKEIDIHQGFQLLTGTLMDSVLTIDTLQIVSTPFVSEYLIYYTGDCNFFKPQRVISRTGDSLHIVKGELEIEWYKNNGTPVANSLNEESIRLVGAGSYYAELRNYFGCKYYSDTVSIVSGIENGELFSEINVFPNPTKGEISIDISSLKRQEELQLLITNINGRAILKTTISRNSNNLDISGLPSGIYIYNLKSENYRFRGKILKE